MNNVDKSGAVAAYRERMEFVIVEIVDNPVWLTRWIRDIPELPALVSGACC